MAHTTSAPLSPTLSPGILAVILLTGVIGFALGQNWPLRGSLKDAPAAIPSEDWHGNIRRSHRTH